MYSLKVTTHIPFIKYLYAGRGKRIFFAHFGGYFFFALLCLFSMGTSQVWPHLSEWKWQGDPSSFTSKETKLKNNQQPKKKRSDITARSQNAPGSSDWEPGILGRGSSRLCHVWPAVEIIIEQLQLVFSPCNYMLWDITAKERIINLIYFQTIFFTFLP